MAASPPGFVPPPATHRSYATRAPPTSPALPTSPLSSAPRTSPLSSTPRTSSIAPAPRTLPISLARRTSPTSCTLRGSRGELASSKSRASRARVSCAFLLRPLCWSRRRCRRFSRRIGSFDSRYASKQRSSTSAIETPVFPRATSARTRSNLRMSSASPRNETSKASSVPGSPAAGVGPASANATEDLGTARVAPGAPGVIGAEGAGTACTVATAAGALGRAGEAGSAGDIGSAGVPVRASKAGRAGVTLATLTGRIRSRFGWAGRPNSVTTCSATG